MLVEHLLCAKTASSVQFFDSLEFAPEGIMASGLSVRRTDADPLKSPLALTGGEWDSELCHKVSVKKPN